MRSPSAQNRVNGAAASAGTQGGWPSLAREPRSHLGRLRQMSLMEIAIRGGQEVRKLIERFGPLMQYGDPAAILRRHAPGLATPMSALGFLRETAPRRFFSGLGVSADARDASTLHAGLLQRHRRGRDRHHRDAPAGSSRVPHAAARRSDRLAPRSRFESASAARALERPRPARRRTRSATAKSCGN